MSSELLFKLEEKIDNAVETVELLRLQVEELEDRNQSLIDENAALKNKQTTWEQNLSLMLQKLDSVNSKQESSLHQFEEAETMA